jgi:uncharacterized protein (TIGR02594 family)
MRHRLILAAGCVAALAASTPAFTEPLFSTSPSLVSEARKYMGTNPTARKKLWCATFMNMVLAKAGYAGTNSDAAKSFAYYGRRVSEPRVGAIAVLSRGKRGGHVGVVSGIDSHGNPIIISGNHNKRVGEATYSRKRVIAYVMPAEHRAATQLAARGGSDFAIDSPIAELLAAINAEQNRDTQPRPAAPPQPHHTVHQAADRDIDPFLAELLGLVKDRAQSLPRQAEAPPQRQQRVQQSSGRVAAEGGLSKVFGSTR